MAKDDLFNELAKEVKKANARIDRIEKSFGESSWGAKRVQAFLENEKLNAIKNGKISISKSMSDVQLRAIKDVTERFLKSESTSTIRGIKSSIKNIKSGIKRSYSVSDEEVEDIYMMFEDEDFKNFVHQYREYESDLVELIREAKQKHLSQNDFFEKINQYINVGNDQEMIGNLKRIYKKHVK